MLTPSRINPEEPEIHRERTIIFDYTKTLNEKALVLLKQERGDPTAFPEPDRFTLWFDLPPEPSPREVWESLQDILFHVSQEAHHLTLVNFPLEKAVLSTAKGVRVRDVRKNVVRRHAMALLKRIIDPEA
jgi:hypothetical protein